MGGFREEFFGRHSKIEVLVALLREGETVQAHFGGGSMRPLLDERSLVTIAPVDARRLRRGDVVLCRRGGGVFVHRCIGSRTIGHEEHIITRGDSVPTCDQPIAISNVLGIVTQTRRGSRVTNFESRRWRYINLFLAAYAPYVSAVERATHRLWRWAARYVRNVGWVER
jgi:signal peptidase I